MKKQSKKTKTADLAVFVFLENLILRPPLKSNLF
jgi:hypothetical protein